MYRIVISAIILGMLNGCVQTRSSINRGDAQSAFWGKVVEELDPRNFRIRVDFKGDASGEEILNAMSAVGSSASLGAFRSVEGQLLYHAELNADATTDEIERVVITCGKIADACEALLTIGTDRF